MKMSKCKISNIMPRQMLYGSFNFVRLFFDLVFKKFKITKNEGLIEDKIKKEFLCNFTNILNHERIGIYLIIKNLIEKEPNKNEVIMSPYTIWDVVNMVILAGGKPVFVDIEEKDLVISCHSIQKNFNNKTLAVIFTHYQILSDEIFLIKKFLNEKKCFLLEDCAIINGSSYLYKDKIKDNEFRLLSFGRSKFVSSISGGAILYNNENFYKLLEKDLLNLKNPSIAWIFNYFLKTLKLKIISNKIIFKYFSFWIIKFLHLYFFEKYSRLGDNDPDPICHKKIPNLYMCKISDYQIDNILFKMNRNVYDDKEKRLKNAECYYKNLNKIENIRFLKPSFEEKDTHVNFPIFCEDRDKLYKFLIANNYDCSTYFYKNCNSLKIFENFSKNLPNIKKIEETILILPTYPNYPKENILNICKLINYFYKKF